MLCLTSARFNLTAQRIVQGEDERVDTETLNQSGSYQYQQDPDSGAFIRRWVVDQDIDPVTEGNQGAQGLIIPCIARGIVDGGIRVTGTTERFTPGGLYENVDFVRMSFPSNYLLTKRDKITNIRNKRTGEIIWREEEYDNSATVFDVLGVTPILDPFGNYIENQALLQRAEVQDYG